jgi:hypothetical protein
LENIYSIMFVNLKNKSISLGIYKSVILVLS